MPVEGASLLGPESTLANGQPASWYVETGPDGRFAVPLPVLAGDQERREGDVVLVHAPGHVDALVPETPFLRNRRDASDAGEDACIVLRREAALEGVVWGRAGAPVPFAQVACWFPDAPGGPSTWADAEGRFLLDGLDPATTARVRASAWGDASESTALADVLRPGETARLDPVLSVRTAQDSDTNGWWSIAGTVVDEAGTPVPRASVRGPHFRQGPGSADGVLSDEDGRFRGVLRAFGDELPGWRLEVCKEGLAVLLLTVPDYVVEELREHRRTETLRLVLRAEACVQGRVLDPDGRPVKSARVRVTEQADGDRNPSWILDERCDDEGQYFLSGLDPEASWWLLADSDLVVSRYVSLRGLLTSGEIAVVDVPFPAKRRVPFAIRVGGWQPGMSLTVDGLGRAMPVETWRGQEYAGPHRFTLLDAADHPIASSETDVPYEADAWYLEMEAPACEECARGEEGEERVIEAPENESEE